jgi:hypothetical protein
MTSVGLHLGPKGMKHYSLLLSLSLSLSHLVLEGKPNTNHVRVRIRTHVHNNYIIGHHHTMLKVNSGKVL